MTSICNINVYLKYTVRYLPSCGDPFVEQFKHAVQLSSLFVFTNIVKHASWFINFPYYDIYVFVSGETKISCSRFNYQDFTQGLW